MNLDRCSIKGLSRTRRRLTLSFIIGSHPSKKRFFALCSMEAPLKLLGGLAKEHTEATSMYIRSREDFGSCDRLPSPIAMTILAMTRSAAVCSSTSRSLSRLLSSETRMRMRYPNRAIERRTPSSDGNTFPPSFRVTTTTHIASIDVPQIPLMSGPRCGEGGWGQRFCCSFRFLVLERDDGGE